jgi:hypothetical protein
LDSFVDVSQGVALGFQLFAPSGLPILGSYPREIEKKPKKNARCGEAAGVGIRIVSD